MRNFRQLPPASWQREEELRCPCCGASSKGADGGSFKVSLKFAMLVFNLPMAMWTIVSSGKLNAAAHLFAGRTPQGAEEMALVGSTGLPIAFWVIGDIALALAMLLARD